MGGTIVNVICSIVMAACTISVMLSSRSIRRIANNVEDMKQKQIEYMNQRDG